MKKARKAFSLILAIGLVLISVLLAFTIMEYIVPFLRNIRGAENSVNAYYFSYSGLEKGLFFFSTRDDEKAESSFTFGDDMRGFSYETFSSGNILPAPGTGESEYNRNWSTINMGRPIQLSVGNGYLNGTTNNLQIAFRIPELNGNLKEGGIPIINWQLSSSEDTLNSTTGSLDKFKGSEIKGNFINIGGLEGTSINDNADKNPGDILSTRTFSGFYQVNCLGANRCILRFSVINSLTTTSGTAPYLEWQLKTGETDTSPKIPLRYSRIESVGRTYGFQKTLQIRVPQDTVSEAFDFAVFQ